MKVWCSDCNEHHIDKDFVDDFPKCSFIGRRGFYMLDDEEKLRLWQLWINPLYDELAVKYRLMVRGGAMASPADIIMEDGVPVYYHEGYSSKWRRVTGNALVKVAIRLANLGKRVMGDK